MSFSSVSRRIRVLLQIHVEMYIDMNMQIKLITVSPLGVFSFTFYSKKNSVRRYTLHVLCGQRRALGVQVNFRRCQKAKKNSLIFYFPKSAVAFFILATFDQFRPVATVLLFLRNNRLYGAK